MNIFEDILDTRSLTVIHYKIEDAMPSCIALGSIEDQKAFALILETNSLDEIWAIAHERLGQFEQAKALRDWIAKKTRRG
jgi:hypothetical protein